MKKIGFTINLHSNDEIKRLYQDELCDEVILAQLNQPIYSQFESLIKNNRESQLIVLNVDSIGVPIEKLAELLVWILDNRVKLSFIEKPVSSDKEYLKMLSQLAQDEKNKINNECLMKQEKDIGRPKTPVEKIVEIRYLRQVKKMKIREIAKICDISIGTVHKYISE